MSAATPLPKESRAISGSAGKSLLLFPGLLLPAVSDEDAGHAVVSFVAGGIENHMPLVGGSPHFDHHGPRPAPRLRVIERYLAPQIVRVHAGDPLDHLVGIDVGP